MKLIKLMQEVEVSDYPTKKELKKQALKFAKDMVESGDYNLQEIFAEVSRLKEVINEVEGQLRNALPQEGFEAFGLKVSYSQGGDTINYKEDWKVKELEEELKERKELVKTANKSKKPIYDSEGVQVEKVSTTPRKSSLKVTF